MNFRPRFLAITSKWIKHLSTGVLIFSLMHVYTSITSKEEVYPHLPLYHPELDSFLLDFHSLASDMFSESNSPGAAIAIVKNGQVVYKRAFGVKKVNTNDSIDIHTTFRIASVSKTFAGILTSKMVEQNKLSLEDNVQQHFPSFSLKKPAYAECMKIKHILSQTTGLIQHAYTNYIEDGKDLNTMIRSLSDVKLLAEPGQLFSYQNVAYGIIEPILESATGYDYNSLMEKEIFQPLNMIDASLDYESMVSGDNVAYPNFPRRGGWAAGKISKTYYNVPSAGGINASISDMANYMLAMTGHRPDVISAEMIKDVLDPQIKTRIRWKYFSRWKDYKKSYYGLGWRIVINNESTIAYHGGYVNGYRSQLAINTDEDIGICVLTNSPTSFSSKLIPAFLKVIDEYKEKLRFEEINQVSIAQYP